MEKLIRRRDQGQKGGKREGNQTGMCDRHLPKGLKKGGRKIQVSEKANGCPP